MKTLGMEYFKILSLHLYFTKHKYFCTKCHCVSLRDVLMTFAVSCFLELGSCVISCLHNVDAAAWLIIRKHEERKNMK